MHKLCLWATYVASVLATFDKVIQIDKRNSNCSDADHSQNNAQQRNTDAEAGVVQVNVGGPNATLKYFPEDGTTLTNLAVGTIVQFNFMPKNHTVTESTFDDPCHPIAANITEAKGREPIKTGFVPVSGNETFTKAFRIKITDTKPIWLYCGQVGHCQKGMVMVINQNTTDTTDKTLANFRAKAMQVPLPDASGAASASSTLVASTTSTGAVNAVTPAATDGPSLAASATSVNPSVFVSTRTGTNGAYAMPTQMPGKLAAIGGFAVAVALL